MIGFSGTSVRDSVLERGHMLGVMLEEELYTDI